MTGDKTMKRLLMTFFVMMCVAAAAAVKPANSQTITLKPGWNLVTLERPVVDTDMAKFLLLKPMTLDATGKCYVRCMEKADIKIGAGYWIHSDTEQAVELVTDKDKTSWETATLTNGWNLIGVADNSTWQSQAAVIWQWKDGRYQRVSPAELTAGVAYMVKPL